MITFNTVKVDINGKEYEFHKLAFGPQRQILSLQREFLSLNKKLAKKYDCEVSELGQHVSPEESLELADINFKTLDIIKELFVNPEEADVLKYFGGEELAELIKLLS